MGKFKGLAKGRNERRAHESFLRDYPESVARAGLDMPEDQVGAAPRRLDTSLQRNTDPSATARPCNGSPPDAAGAPAAPQSAPLNARRKKGISANLYEEDWTWIRTQAAEIKLVGARPGEYVRAAQVLTEIVAAAIASGLDVREARSLGQVRDIALGHFRKDKT